jgi:hypothetical protein
VKSTAYDACADVIRSPHPAHEPPPAYSPRRRHNAPCGRVCCLSRERMASVAATVFMWVPPLRPRTLEDRACMHRRCAFWPKNATSIQPLAHVRLNPLYAFGFARAAAIPGARQRHAASSQERRCTTGVPKHESSAELQEFLYGVIRLVTFRLDCLGPHAPPRRTLWPMSATLAKLGEPGGSTHPAGSFRFSRE